MKYILSLTLAVTLLTNQSIASERLGQGIPKAKRQESGEYAYYRDPGIAYLASWIFAGAGQYYNEQYGKGMFMSFIDVVCLGLIREGFEDDYTFDGDYRDEDDDNMIIVLGAIGWMLNKHWSTSDARKTAIKLNRENGFISPTIKPIASKKRVGAMLSYRF